MQSEKFCSLDDLVDAIIKAYFYMQSRNEELNCEMAKAEDLENEFLKSLDKKQRIQFAKLSKANDNINSMMLEDALVCGFNYAVYCHELTPDKELPKIIKA